MVRLKNCSWFPTSRSGRISPRRCDTDYIQPTLYRCEGTCRTLGVQSRERATLSIECENSIWRMGHNPSLALPPFMVHRLWKPSPELALSSWEKRALWSRLEVRPTPEDGRHLASIEKESAKSGVGHGRRRREGVCLRREAQASGWPGRAMADNCIHSRNSVSVVSRPS